MQSWQSKDIGTTTLLRVCIVHMCVVLFATLFYGCMSISVTNATNRPVDKDSLGGRYNIKNVDPGLAAALRENAPRSIVFTREDDPTAIPLDIRLSDYLEEKDSVSIVAAFVGSISFTALPTIRNIYKINNVSFESPIETNHITVELVGRKSWSGLTPLGFLPLAFPLEGYACALGDYGDEWREEDSAWSNALHTAVAKAIIPMLTKSHYAECTSRQQEERLRKEAEAARQKELAAAHEREKLLRLAEVGWPQEMKLREFAIKEMPEIWEMVVARRADIFSHRANLLKLRSFLIDFGRFPESDSEYVASRKRYDTERAELVRIFRSIEEACFVSCKNASLYEGAEELEKTKQAVDECVKEVLR